MFGILREKAIVATLALIVLGVLIGQVHNRAVDTGSPFFVQNVTRSVVAPVDDVFGHVLSVARGTVYFFRPRNSILRENKRLREQNRRLTMEIAKLREATEENVRLREALGLRKSLPYEMIAAEIVSRKPSNWFDTATINRGRTSGIARGAAIVNYQGLVGQVLEANSLTSQMVALTDSTSAVGAMVQRSRVAGMLQGQGADYLVLRYLAKDADVKASDVVISSGMGGVIPKGLVIGRVVKVIRNSVAGTTSALVRPSVRFGQLEQVFVIRMRNGVTE